MALSPADFAAYSRATGTPYPEDPEERAALAPAVRDFRQSQLRQTQSTSDGGGLAGLAAVGLGALGALAAVKGLSGRKPSAGGRKGGVTLADLSDPRNAAVSQVAETAVKSSIPTQRSVMPTEEESMEQYSRQLTEAFPEPTASEMEALSSPSRTSKIFARLATSPQYRPDPKDINYARFGPPSPEVAAARREQATQDLLRFAQQRQEDAAAVANQTIGALESGEDQMTGRIKAQLSRNEDLDMSQIEMLENIAQENNALMSAQAEPSQMAGYVADAPIAQAASQLPDGLPVDQAEGLRVLDLQKKESFRIPPRALSQEEIDDPLVNEARQYLLSQEVDTDFDYSAENKKQALQVRDRIQRAQTLQNQANQILAEIRGEAQPVTQQLSPEDFAKQFNKQYREEVNPELKMVDNARQRAELLAAQAESTGQDLESLLFGESSPIETTMRGKALRGGKINAAGDIIYQNEAGDFALADTGLKPQQRQAQGKQFQERAKLLNQIKSASDEELSLLITQGQEAIASNRLISSLDKDAYKFASETLIKRALRNPAPTPLQLDALNRYRTSIDESRRILQEQKNQRPTLSPGPAQDVARAMETLRRGMIVEPSEPLPVLPSIQQMRVGFVTDVDPDELKKMTKAERVQLLGPVVSASDVYTGAAAEAAGPVIFTGKSKANTVLSTPPITGSVRTSTGRYLTQDNPDVLGTVYNVAGTPANRAISAQVEQNAQNFLKDAIAGGLQQKAPRVAEPYRTPGTYGVIQFNLLTPPLTEKGLSQNQLGLPGLEASQRTGYAQYQPGRSKPAPISPFIGEMTGGTVVVVPPAGPSTGVRRDIGAPSASIDLTRRGEKSKYFPRYPEERFITGTEPAPIGPITQSPGLSKMGPFEERLIQGAGGIPIIQQTSRGQSVAYPRMDKPVTALGFRGETITNIPRYGINPGAEDWREDLMRSAYRRGGPIRTYQG